ncbi:glutamate--tRNA ligase [Candidatus Woesearchaeota archaeon]|nr:glutamate--tRNA ligase [Candidatus Woesearchaeota archaeon]
MDLSLLIRKHALHNAVKYGGKANPGAVIGKILAEEPSLKEQMKDVGKHVAAIIKDVNSLKSEQKLAELKSIAPELLEVQKKEQTHELPELPNAEQGKVVTAFPPEPSGYPHHGHAKAALINYLYARKYDGKFIVRFEDTNPDLAKEEYVNAIKKGLQWLGTEWDELIFISDTMDLLYKHGEDMLLKGQFYACTCPVDIMRNNRATGTACSCRSRSPSKNLAYWEKMKAGNFDKGQAVIRWKGDLQNNNTVMRDPTMFRIIKARHWRHGDKYCVWPSYDFAAAVSDGAEGVTHRVRSKEFELRAELQRTLQQWLGYKPTIIVEQARANLQGVEASKRKIRQLISEGKLRGWDDPRLSTLMALHRRGITPEGLKNFLLTLGVTKHDSTASWDSLYAENRKIIESIANRYFFVAEPVKIAVEGAPEQTVELDLHPDHHERGARRFKTGTDFYIPKADAAELKQRNLYRLMECLNFTKTAKGYAFHSLKVEEYKENGKRIMHWLPADEPNVAVDVLMPDGTTVSGLAEKAVRDLPVEAIIQFERFGFVRLDEKTPDKLVFWYAHK